ncbi:cache domain-containing protein [Pseudodesulfovibrio sp.]|nr:cache domain-containing protein [Pseudodesulfovibrio sp.]
MKNGITLFLIILLFSVLALASGPEDKARRLVEDGVKYIESAGMHKAASAFMDPKGAFFDGSYYLFVVQYDGLCIAHGAQPSLVGVDLSKTRDSDGVLIKDEMVKAALAGGGWAKYRYTNPVTGEVQKKRAWVQPVPGMEAYIGCGIYYE